MPSKDFQDFYSSCFDTSFGATRDGLNVQALLRLKDDERTEAERLVLQTLETGLDSRPIRAAGYMKLQSAREFLKRRLTSAIDTERPDNQIYVAWSLFQIERNAESANIIAGILNQFPQHQQWTRMMAVEALADFGEIPLAITALLDTLVDADEFIAYLATASLKRIFKSDSAIISALNEIELMQVGKKAFANRTKIQKVREHVKQLAHNYLLA